MKLVLDTNVVLDWLVFDDAAARRLADCGVRERVELLANEHTLHELRRVLNYPAFKLDEERAQKIFHDFQAIVSRAPLPESLSRDNLLLPAGFPRCRDSDDDVFLALAYHGNADALVSKDKALLKLRKKALKFGVRIVTVSELNTMLEAMRS